MKRLRDLREDLDLTQTKVASIIGCSQTTYSRYETGNTSVPYDILDKLADLYNVSVDYLLERTDVKKPYKKRDYKDN